MREALISLKSRVGENKPLLRVKQVHGAGLVDAVSLLQDSVDSWTTPPTLEADGIFSGDLDAVLAVQTADCLPILMGSRTTKEVAAIHAGWRGLSKGILRNAMRRFRKQGSSPDDIFAAIGPGICIRCYEVGRDVASHFPESADPVPGKPGAFMLDLCQAAEVSLIGAGLSSSNIDIIGKCTSCAPEGFFSHRRSADTGRQLSFIAR